MPRTEIKLNQPNFIHNVPKTYLFFSLILQVPSIFKVISKFVLLFGYFQDFMVSFTPISIENTNHNLTFIGKLSFYVLTYSSPENSHSFNVSILVLWLVIFAHIFLILWAYLVFYYKQTVNYYVSRFRVFLCFLVPSIFLYPMVTNIALLRDYSSEIPSSNIIRNPILSVFILIIFLIFLYWVSPLLIHTPLLGSAHLPSRLIPDDLYFLTEITGVFLYGYIISVPAQSTKYFYTFFSISLGIYKLYQILTLPFFSLFDSCLFSAVSFSQIINPIFCLFCIHYSSFTERIILIIGIIIFLISCLVFHSIFIHKLKENLSFVTSKNQNIIGFNKNLSICQSSLYNESLSPVVLQNIISEYGRSGQINLLIALVYYKFCIGNNDNDRYLQSEIDLLCQIRSFHWTVHVSILQLIKLFCNKYSHNSTFGSINEIQNDIHDYKARVDKMWAFLLKGKLNKASSINRDLALKLNEIKRSFFKYKLLFPNNPSVIELNKQFFCHVIPVKKVYKSTYENTSIWLQSGNFNDNLDLGQNQTSNERNPDKQKIYNPGNFLRLPKKPVPHIFISFITFSILIMIISFLFYEFPIFKCLSPSKVAKILPDVLSTTLNITKDWFYLVHGLSLLFFCNITDINENNYSFPIFSGQANLTEFDNALLLNSNDYWSSFQHLEFKSSLQKHMLFNLFDLMDQDLSVNLHNFKRTEISKMKDKFSFNSDLRLMKNFEMFNDFERNEINQHYLVDSKNESFFYQQIYNQIEIGPNSIIKGVYNDSFTEDFHSNYEILQSIKNISFDLESNTNKLRSIFIRYANNSLQNFWIKAQLNLNFSSGSSLFTSLLSALNEVAISIHITSTYTGFCSPEDTKQLLSLVNFYSSLLIQTEDLLVRALRSTHSYIDEQIKKQIPNNSINWLKISLSILATLICNALYILSDFHIFQILKCYFRPTSHPNNERRITRDDEVKNYKFPLSLVSVFSFQILLYFLFYLQSQIIFERTTQLLTQVAQENDLTIELQCLFLQSGRTMTMLHQAARNPSNRSYFDGFVSYFNAFLDTNFIVNELISYPNNTFSFLENYSSVMDYQCNFSDLDNSIGIHDLYRCWPFSHVMSLYYAYLSKISNERYVKINSSIFYHSNHILLAHIQPELSALSSHYTNLSSKSNEYAVYYINLEIFLLLFFIFIGTVSYFIIYQYLNMKVYHISCIYALLPPKFIAKHMCLMKYTIDIDDTSSDQHSSFLSLLEAAKSPLLVLSSKLTILSLTRDIQGIFGYKLDELIGQPLDILIPKELNNGVQNIEYRSQESNSLSESQLSQGYFPKGQENSSKFMKELEDLQITHNQITRLVVGRKSQGRSVNLAVVVTPIELDNSFLYVIEFKDITDNVGYESLILFHTNLVKNIINSAMPLALFPDITSNINKRYIPMDQKSLEQQTKNITDPQVDSMLRHFENGLLLSLTLIPSDFDYDGSFEKLASEEEEYYKASLEYVLDNCSGTKGVIVLDASLNHVLCAFVGNGGVDKNISQALDFIGNYIRLSLNNPTGFLVSLENFDVVLFPLPDIPHETKKTDSETTSTSAPHMTVELLSPMMNMLPQLTSLLIPGHLLMSDSLLQYMDYQAISPTKVPNNLGLGLTMVPLGIDSDSNESENEVSDY